MGGNVSETTAKILNGIDIKLGQSVKTNASADCAIKLGSINGDDWENCIVIGSNQCGASTQATIESITDTLVDAWQKATTDQKTNFASFGLNANSTIQDVQNVIKQNINQECVANASLSQVISSEPINIKKCRNSTFKNINTGDAIANCAIRSAITAVGKAEQDAEVKQTATGFFEGIGSIFNNPASVIASVIICILLIVGIVIFIWFKFGGSSTTTSYPTYPSYQYPRSGLIPPGRPF